MTCSLIEFIWIWTKIQHLDLPRHHQKISCFLEALYRHRTNGLLMAFRNSGKSTLVGLFGAWLLLQNPNARLLILSADQNLAKKMVHHMKHIIETHPLTTSLIPQNADEWASDRFTIRRDQSLRDPSVLAKGLMANITGCRADIILCDDVEVPKTCDTAGKRELLRQKLSELDYILTPQGFILYIGTPHTFDTIYQIGNDGFLKNWHCLKIPLLLSNGDSAWPERFPLDVIAALKKRTGSHKFLSQMMLEPVPLTDSRLDIHHLKFYSGDLSYREVNQRGVLTLNGEHLKGVSAWWDPAFGSLSGDKSVVACVFFDDKANAYLHRLLYLTVPKDQEATSFQCREVSHLIRECYLPALHLETNGIGKFLPALLRQELARQHLSCSVIEETSHQNKVSRILSALDAPLMNGSLWIRDEIRSTPFLQEMQDFKPNGRSHDDSLDALAGCLLSEPIHLERIPPAFIKNNLEWRF